MKRIKKTIIIWLLALSASFTALNNVSYAASAFPVTVTDDLGRTVTVPHPPQRIVCISPAVTEIVYALGLGDKVVGVDLYSNYPPEAISKQKISNAYTPDAEEVAALYPDLVIMYSYFGPGDPYVEAIAGLGIPIIALRPKNLTGILNDICLVGEATDTMETAENLVSQLNERINQVKIKTENVTDRPKVYAEFWYPPPWTFGPGSWCQEMIEVAGGINAFSDAADSFIGTTDEEVIARNPDIIIISYGSEHLHLVTLEDLRNRPGWENIKAVREGKVYLIDEDLIIRPGPRIVLGLEMLASFLHPELFGTAYTLTLNTSILKTSFQTLTVTSVANIEVNVLKATGNGTLTVKVVDEGPQIPSNMKLVGKYIKADCSTPEGLVFTMRVYYSKAELNASEINEDSLKMYYWDSNAEEWVSISSFINKEESYVEALVTHLTSFALMGESLPKSPPQPLWETPLPLWLAIVIIVIISLITSSAIYVLMKKRE